MENGKGPRREAQRGTTHFYRGATAYVLARGVRFTLALRFVRKGERVSEVAKALYQRVAASGLRLRRYYFDRGFLSVELLQYLQAQGVSAIIAVSLGIGPAGSKPCAGVDAAIGRCIPFTIRSMVRLRSRSPSSARVNADNRGNGGRCGWSLSHCVAGLNLGRSAKCIGGALGSNRAIA